MRNISWVVRGVVGFSACAALLAAAGTTLFQPRQSVQTVSYSQFNKDKLLARSEPLMRALLPNAVKFETGIYQNTTFTTGGQSIHNMSVDCSDPASGDSAHFLWNSDTGELVRASRFRQHDLNGEYNEKSSKTAAISLAWDWFHALKIDRPAEEWRIVGTHPKHYGQWDIYLRSGDRCAIITVSTASGQLIQAMCSHLPDAKMAWMPFKAITQS